MARGQSLGRRSPKRVFEPIMTRLVRKPRYDALDGGESRDWSAGEWRKDEVAMFSAFRHRA